MIPRWIRACVLAAVLVVATSACRLDVTVATTIEKNGSGRFALRFDVDRELAALARSAGRDTLESLCTVANELGRTGWTVNRSTAGGRLVLQLDRRFSGPDDLARALDDLGRCLSTTSGSTGRFFSLTTERSSSFLKAATSVEGKVDLSPAGLLAQSGLSADDRRRLQAFFGSGGSEFFGFLVSATLPGRVSSSAGDPRDVQGRTVTWKPRLGTVMTFRAASSAYKPAGAAAVGVPALLVVAIVVAAVVRRKRRARAPV